MCWSINGLSGVFCLLENCVFLGYDKLLCDMQILLLGVHIKCWNCSTVTVMINMTRNCR